MTMTTEPASPLAELLARKDTVTLTLGEVKSRFGACVAHALAGGTVALRNGATGQVVAKIVPLSEAERLELAAGDA